MIRHLLKMVWNRKRVNGFIMIEIFFSFIVLFIVMSAALYFFGNYRHPLGYSIERVWTIDPNPNLTRNSHRKEQAEGMKQLLLMLKDMPEIESVAGTSVPPYSHSMWTSGEDYNGRSVLTEIGGATDGMKEVLDINLTAGRWFSAEDNDTTFKPAVINERLAHDLYGAENPIGKELPFDKQRVIGVVADYRKAGEFSELGNFLFQRIRTDDTASNFIPYSILIRVRPGTTAAFQERLVKAMESVNKSWTFDVAQVEHERDQDMKVRLTPLIAGAVVAIFLLSMVALGLIGVLWQNVSQRTTEIGLRRALGGTAGHVSRQIQGEQFVITTIGVAAAAVLVMQIPLLNLTGDTVTTDVYIAALAVSFLTMYAITYVCSMFPSWMAMDIEPAEALHYE